MPIWQILDLGNNADTEAVINGLRRQIGMTSEGRNLWTITYTGPNREKATKVLQALLTVFVDANLGSSRQDMQTARNFIDEQLKVYATALDGAEKRMADFKAKNLGFLPGDGSYAAKFDNAKQEFAKTQAELEDATHRRDELKKQIASVPKTVETMNAGPDFGSGPPLDDVSTGPDPKARIADLEQKIKVLLQTDTELHPDVVRLKRQLEQAKREAEESKDQAPAAAANPQGIRSSAPNPVYEQLTLQLIALETAIASVTAKLQRNQTEVEKWQGLATAVPEVAAQMSKLNRDYDAIRRSYDELLNRREATKIGNDMETQTQTVQFRIIDPPEAPALPVAPKRALLISAVLAASICAGFAFAFLLARIDDSVKTLTELRELFAVPVLGGVSIVSRAARRQRFTLRAGAFAVTCLALVVVYAGLLSVVLKQPHA